MTITIDPRRHRATRGDGLHLVPSQRTERHQAVDPPQVWPGTESRALAIVIVIVVPVAIFLAALIASGVAQEIVARWLR